MAEGVQSRSAFAAQAGSEMALRSSCTGAGGGGGAGVSGAPYLHFRREPERRAASASDESVKMRSGAEAFKGHYTGRVPFAQHIQQ